MIPNDEGGRRIYRPVRHGEQPTPAPADDTICHLVRAVHERFLFRAGPKRIAAECIRQGWTVPLPQIRGVLAGLLPSGCEESLTGSAPDAGLRGGGY